jgi:hypothetical protein
MTAVATLKEVRYPELPSDSRDVVLISGAEMQSLPEYSMSVPTGAYVGKWWKRNLNARTRNTKPLWRACCYAPIPGIDPKVELHIHYCPVRYVE